jgi:C-terminal peptidase prc
MVTCSRILLLITVLLCLRTEQLLAQGSTDSARAVWEDVMELITTHYYEPVDEVKLTLATLAGVAKGLQTDVLLPSPPPTDSAGARDLFVREISRMSALPGQRSSPEQATLRAVDYLCEHLLKFSFLTTEQATEALQFVKASAPADIGMTNYREGDRILCKPVEDGPAWKLGIRSGDELVALDGVPVRGQPEWKVLKDRRGIVGSVCSITVQQAREPKRLITGKITRQVIRAAPSMQREITGVRLRIPSFSAEHDEAIQTLLRQALQELKEKEVLTLDLKGNSGGSTATGVEVLSALVPGTRPLVIAKRHIRGPKSADYPADVTITAPPLSSVKRVVILVDAQSASTSELITQVLLETPELRVTVGGEKTYGKHLIQNSFTLPRRASMSITFPYGYMTTSKGTTWEKGILPTFAR